MYKVAYPYRLRNFFESPIVHIFEIWFYEEPTANDAREAWHRCLRLSGYDMNKYTDQIEWTTEYVSDV